jgi:hypothetical protein
MNATSMKLKHKKKEIIVKSCFCLLLEVVGIFKVPEIT